MQAKWYDIIDRVSGQVKAQIAALTSVNAVWRYCMDTGANPTTVWAIQNKGNKPYVQQTTS